MRILAKSAWSFKGPATISWFWLSGVLSVMVPGLTSSRSEF
jgi:hypothetical protein